MPRERRKTWLACPDCGTRACPPDEFCRRRNHEEWPEGSDLGDPIYQDGSTCTCPGCGESYIVKVRNDRADLRPVKDDDCNKPACDDCPDEAAGAVFRCTCTFLTGCDGSGRVQCIDLGTMTCFCPCGHEGDCGGCPACVSDDDECNDWVDEDFEP